MKKSGLFIILACLVLLSGFVFAEVLVTLSSGGNFTGIDEDVNVAFNISINNTDFGSASNITQVNITLPVQMTFDPNSQGSDAPQHNFSVDGQTLSWSNLTHFLVNNVTLNYFYFNATGNVPGNYLIQIFTSNGSRVLNENITIEINDTTLPATITYENPTSVDYANLSQQNIEFNVSATDNFNISSILLEVFNHTGGRINHTVGGSNVSNVYLNFSFLTVEGTYTINATVNDTGGNVNSSASRRVTLDRTNPTVVMDLSSSTSSSLTIDIANGDVNSLGVVGSGVTGTCSSTLGSVSGSGAKQTLTATGLDCLTSYSITATCTDRAGNQGSFVKSFTTQPCGGGFSSGGSGSSSGSTTDDGDATSDPSDSVSDGSGLESDSDVSSSDASGLEGESRDGLLGRNNILVIVLALILVGLVWWLVRSYSGKKK